MNSKVIIMKNSSKRYFFNGKYIRLYEGGW